MAARDRFRPCLSTSQVLSEVLNDEDLYDGETEVEDLELDLDLGLDQLTVPRILRDYDDQPESGPARPSRSSAGMHKP